MYIEAAKEKKLGMCFACLRDGQRIIGTRGLGDSCYQELRKHYPEGLDFFPVARRYKKYQGPVPGNDLYIRKTAREEPGTTLDGKPTDPDLEAIKEKNPDGSTAHYTPEGIYRYILKLKLQRDTLAGINRKLRRKLLALVSRSNEKAEKLEKELQRIEHLSIHALIEEGESSLFVKRTSGQGSETYRVPDGMEDTD